MRIEEAIKLHKQMIATEIEKRLAKAHDYSQDDDVHSNFAIQAGIFKVLADNHTPVDITTPIGCAMFLEILKVIRALNLIARATPALNESFRDTAFDGRVYWELIYELWEVASRAQANEPPHL
jgi:hypothetical protein